MTVQQTKYALLTGSHLDRLAQYKNYLRIVLFGALAAICVFMLYINFFPLPTDSIELNYPPLRHIPSNLEQHIRKLGHQGEAFDQYLFNKTLVEFNKHNKNESNTVIESENESIRPSTLGNFIYSAETSMLSASAPSSSSASSSPPSSSSSPSSSAASASSASSSPLANVQQTENTMKLVCYYASPIVFNQTNDLYPDNIDPNLCTHINVGMVGVVDNKIQIEPNLVEMFKRTTQLKNKNPNLKVLIWVGGAYSPGFSEMVSNHANRKEFIQSVKYALETYALDGIDLDWEFPITHNRERQHFSQLLHEIRREYQREHRTYLLSVAVAAPEGIVFFAYDIGEINKYADYVNVMTYDYHFYSEATPFTGFNAPLYARDNEQALLATLNINATVMYWNKHGLDKNKIVIGLPTYGHSFTLVNPYNFKVGAPAKGNGRAGSYGFITYADVCWFKQNNIYVFDTYDEETCSPYLHSATEWISYENIRSIECKTNYVKNNGFGGVMIFSLNTDDYSSYCYENKGSMKGEKSQFPLVWKINSILFDKN